MTLSRTVQVQAPAERVWGLVSDLPRMGDLSPENAGGTWRRGASGPAVGARFRGANRSGRRRWSTDALVTRCEPGSTFAFVVTFAGLQVAEWSYDVMQVDASSCTVTETWTDRRGALMKGLGGLATGVGDRATFTETSIAHTLAAVKAVAER